MNLSLLNWMEQGCLYALCNALCDDGEASVPELAAQALKAAAYSGEKIELKKVCCSCITFKERQEKKKTRKHLPLLRQLWVHTLFL